MPPAIPPYRCRPPHAPAAPAGCPCATSSGWPPAAIHYLAVFDDHSERPLYLGRSQTSGDGRSEHVCHARDARLHQTGLLRPGLRLRGPPRPRLERRRHHRRRTTSTSAAPVTTPPPPTAPTTTTVDRQPPHRLVRRNPTTPASTPPTTPNEYSTTRTARVRCGRITSMTAGATTTVYTARRVITMDPDDAERHGGRRGRESDCGLGRHRRPARRRSRRRQIRRRRNLPGLIDQHLHPILGATTLMTEVIAIEDWPLPDRTYPAARSAQEYRGRLTAARPGTGAQRVAVLVGLPQAVARPNRPLRRWMRSAPPVRSWCGSARATNGSSTPRPSRRSD